MIDIITTDIDGILTDLYRHQIWMVEHYYKSKGKEVPKIKNPKAYDIAEIFEISKNRRNIIWLENYKYYRLYCEARKESFETLKYWQERGKKIGFISAPAFATTPLLGPKVIKWIQEWQNLYDFVPDEVIWCPEKESGLAKAIACKELKSELMIEDKADNLDFTLEVCDSIALSTPYNLGYQPENKPFDFYMKENWSEIRSTVDELDSKPRRLKNV
ncbi:MAG: hypothetical protein PHX04_00905 [Bacilli bacterium]|nr:hypothetical protein [Bacilli bacterium]